MGSILAASLLVAGAAVGAPPAATVERDIERLEADKTSAPYVSDPVGRAKQALTRAHDMEKANDSSHAAALRAVAAEWTAFATDLLRAIRVEGKALLAERTRVELETKLTRSRALLEETVARRGRAREMLDQLEAPPAAAPATAPASPAPENGAAPKAPGPAKAAPPPTPPAAAAPSPAPPTPASPPATPPAAAAPSAAPSTAKPVPPAAPSGARAR